MQERRGQTGSGGGEGGRVVLAVWPQPRASLWNLEVRVPTAQALWGH